MVVAISAAQLQKLAPNARTVYRTAFQTADQDLAAHDVNKTKLRVAHFMAQVLHESGGLTILVENLNYSPERLTKVWPRRFPTVTAAAPFAHNPAALADKVYGGRMGNTAAHDGSKYIGRGLIQLTGRESYAKFGKTLGVDLEKNPELATDPQWVLKIAVEEWHEKNCNQFADADDVNKVTRLINGGLIGIAERKEWLAKTKNVWS